MTRPLVLALILASLTACGFHLRGSYDTPLFIQHLGVKTGPNSTLRPDLLLAMETVGIDPAGGNLIVVIEHDKLITQTTALVTATEVSEVTLVYDVQYRLRYADGRIASDPRNLLLRRTYQNDPTSIVGKTAEADTLSAELRSDAAQQIVRQLAALREDKLLPDVDPGTDADGAATSGSVPDASAVSGANPGAVSSSAASGPQASPAPAATSAPPKTR